MLKNKSIILAVGESSMNDDKPAMVDGIRDEKDLEN